jgi:hypothetical protein
MRLQEITSTGVIAIGPGQARALVCAAVQARYTLPE